MSIIEGQKVAQQILSLVQKEITTKDIDLPFNCLLVGSDPASLLYINRKKEIALELGISFQLHHLPEDATVADVKLKINELNKLNQGYIVQLPLPKKIRLSTNILLDGINPILDADGLTKINRENFLQNGPGSFMPTPVSATMMLLASVDTKIDYINQLPFLATRPASLVPSFLRGQKATIVSDGDIFSAILKFVLENAGMNVRVEKSDSSTLLPSLGVSNLVVTAVGKPGFLTGDMISDDTIIIDVGTTLVKGKTKGDLDWESVSLKASAATPVPGGVGPVTVAMLYANLLFLKLRK